MMGAAAVRLPEAPCLYGRPSLFASREPAPPRLGGTPDRRHAHASVAMAPSAKPGRPGRPPLATARSAAWISRAINSSYAARVLPVIGACARCRLDPDGRLNVTKAQANHLHVTCTPARRQSPRPSADSTSPRRSAANHSRANSRTGTRRFSRGIRSKSRAVSSITHDDPSERRQFPWTRRVSSAPQVNLRGKQSPLACLFESASGVTPAYRPQGDDEGKLAKTRQATTLNEAARVAGELVSELRRRDCHPALLTYCDEELIRKSLFHAIQEAAKSIPDRLRRT
jgi:hypothetical protein